MSKTSKILMAVMVLAVLLLGVGYAAIQNVTLNITGTAVANPNQANFKVKFSGDPIISDEDKVTVGLTDELNSTMNVTGLTQKGEEVTVIYTIHNASEDLSADLKVETTNSNTEYFTIKSELGKTSLTSGEATTLTVTTMLTKTPIKNQETTIIGIQLTIMPVEPGMEGTSEGINGSSQSPEGGSTLPTTTLADLVTNDNIGDYIDLGNDVIDNSLTSTTDITTDDWRVLYVDEEENKVYAILADYLPAEQVPASAGLTTDSSYYGVYSDADENTLINGLKNEAAWTDFTSGIKGATAIGTPDAEMLLESYNIKNGTNLDYATHPYLDNSTANFDLYGPHYNDGSLGDPGYRSCYGYWLASIDEYGVGSSGYVLEVTYNCQIGGAYYNDSSLGIRPVVSLPLSTTAELVGGVLTVSQ